MTAALIESTKVIKGAKVENNKFCVSVHFRRVKEEVCLGVYGFQSSVVFGPHPWDFLVSYYCVIVS